MSWLSRRTIVAAAVSAVVVCAASCTPPPEPAGGVVRAGLYHEPQTLSPIGKTDKNAEIIGRLITDSLVQYGPELDLRPMLARSWTVSPDGRTVTFALRDGVRWHDGTPVTASDVVFSVGCARDPVNEARSPLAQFQDLVRIEAVDEHTVVAEYSEAYADFLEAWTLPIVPEHLAGPGRDLLGGAYAQRPVGCGPFRFVRREPGVEIVLQANPDYWMGRPALDGIVFRIIPDDRTAYLDLLRGNLHLMSAPPDIWSEAARSPEAAGLGKFVYYRLSVWYVAWNQAERTPFFRDPGVRRAMLLALDRVRFIDTVLAGLAEPAATTYHPDSIWADPDVRAVPYDPAEAARLLERAGWRDRDGDGVRERDGRPFRFTLLKSTSPQEISDRIAAWMQQSLAEVGVRMDIETIEWNALFERRASGQFDAITAMLSFTPIPDQFELYHSSARKDGLNYFAFSDPETDRLLEQGRVTFDLDERIRIYRALQKRLDEMQPIGCLFHFASPVLHDSRLHGLQPSPIDLWTITPGPRAWSWEPR